jgi:Na+/alanine symporter
MQAWCSPVTSLLHSVPLTAKAFERSFLGDYGGLLVTIGLTLFAFSTAIAWSYYGDRAVTYLFGTFWVMPYRCLYVLGFFCRHHRRYIAYLADLGGNRRANDPTEPNWHAAHA